jgi:hypothetical protein
VGYSNSASAVRPSGATDPRIGSDFTSSDVDERIAHCHLLAPVSRLISSSMPDIDMSPREVLCGTIIAIIHRAIADRLPMTVRTIVTMRVPLRPVEIPQPADTRNAVAETEALAAAGNEMASRAPSIAQSTSGIQREELIDDHISRASSNEHGLASRCRTAP